MTTNKSLRVAIADILHEIAANLLGHAKTPFGSGYIGDDPNTIVLMDPNTSMQIGILGVTSDDGDKKKLIGLRIQKGGKETKILMDRGYSNTLGRALISLEQEHRDDLLNMGEVGMTGCDSSLREIWQREQRGNVAAVKSGEKVVPIRKDIEVPK